MSSGSRYKELASDAKTNNLRTIDSTLNNNEYSSASRPQIGTLTGSYHNTEGEKKISHSAPQLISYRSHLTTAPSFHTQESNIKLSTDTSNFSVIKTDANDQTPSKLLIIFAVIALCLSTAYVASNYLFSSKEMEAVKPRGITIKTKTIEWSRSVVPMKSESVRITNENNGTIWHGRNELIAQYENLTFPVLLSNLSLQVPLHLLLALEVNSSFQLSIKFCENETNCLLHINATENAIEYAICTYFSNQSRKAALTYALPYSNTTQYFVNLTVHQDVSEVSLSFNNNTVLQVDNNIPFSSSNQTAVTHQQSCTMLQFFNSLSDVTILGVNCTLETLELLFRIA